MRGVVWSKEPNPTVSLATKTLDGSGEGQFTTTLTGLSEGTKYYVRAYATNASGTSYSDELAFTTASIAKIREIKFYSITHKYDYDDPGRLKKRTITFEDSKSLADSMVLVYSPGKVNIKEYDTDFGLYLDIAQPEDCGA
jgi:hypothetical protein